MSVDRHAIEELGVVSVQVKLYVVSVHQVGDILGVRRKAEWAENGTLGNTAVDREAECLLPA